MFTFAVVGFGARGRKYASLLKAHGEKLVAVCDRDEKVFEVARKEYNIPEMRFLPIAKHFFPG